MRHQSQKDISVRFIAIIFFSSVVAFSCNSQPSQENKVVKQDTIKPAGLSDAELAGSFSSQTLLHFDSTSLSAFTKQYPRLKPFEQRMKRFYSNRKWAYAWFDKNGLIEPAGNLYNKVNNVKEEGWPGTILYQDVLQSMMNEDTIPYDSRTANPEIELMLTAQYFFYAENVWTGLGAKGMKAVNWDLPQKKISYDEWLDSLLSISSAQRTTTEPVFRQYGMLKGYLKKYRDLESQNGLQPIKGDKKYYRKGDTSAVIAAIRKDLFLFGDLATDDQSSMFDATLENAVKNFQQRFGLKDDGVVGAEMITQLNYPVEKRIEQIIVNMERCRWVPVALNKDYIVVNIPAYRFHAFENDSLVWSMDVVVGSEMNKTAIFTGMMNSVVFSPYWNVPPGIYRKETLPAMKKDNNYLARNHMERTANGVRQKPGPWNALGKVKFLFPNSHNIYLHDTPSKWAFEKEKRAFSHGCIRVSDPRRLALYILRNQPAWTEQKVDAAMNANKEQYVKVADPVPVFIVYLTSWVDKQGRLNIRHDVYNRDSRLAQMIIDASKL
ncbi:MAG: murein L,D-transpeptidase [Flavisolibacter sp.]